MNVETGKVSGDTIYNLLKLGESEIDSNERPLHPHRINKVKVLHFTHVLSVKFKVNIFNIYFTSTQIKILHNPFDDIEPRAEYLSKTSAGESKKQRKEGVKNFKLISFGEEAEQDETEVESFSRDQQPKVTQSTSVAETKTSSSSSRKNEKERGEVKKTLDEPTKRKKSLSPKSRTPPHKLDEKVHDTNDSDDSDYELSLEKEKMTILERKKREIQDEIQSLKKEYHKERKDKDKEKLKDEENSSSSSAKDSANGNRAVKDYLVEKEKYKKCKTNVKGASRENLTLQLLEKFKVKLHSSKDSSESHHEASTSVPAGEEHENDDDSWWSHKLDFSESQVAVLAKDASKKEDNWYDIYDPRNPLNKRKRGGEGGGGDEKSTSSSKQKKIV